MRLVIEQADFKRLTPETQRELLESLVGKGLLGRKEPKKKTTLLWRQPYDLTSDICLRMMHGISEPHRARLRLFAEKGGRVSQKALLAVNNDTDMKVLSHFQAVLSRRIRRFVDDPDKRLHLIGWDYTATKWDKDHTQIVDGVYYVTDRTTRSLQDYFGIKPDRRPKKK